MLFRQGKTSLQNLIQILSITSESQYPIPERSCSAETSRLYWASKK